MESRTPRRWVRALAILPLVLLPILVGLQFRWTEELKQADIERSKQFLTTGTHRFASDLEFTVLGIERSVRAFDGEIGTPPHAIGNSVQAWRANAEWPELVSSAFLIELRPGSAGSQLYPLPVSAGDPQTTQEIEWPDELTEWKRFVADLAAGPGTYALPTSPPGVFLPVEMSEHRPAPHFVLVVLDETTLSQQIFPQLYKRHFGEQFGVPVTVDVRRGGTRLFVSHEPLVGAEDVRVVAFRNQLELSWASDGAGTRRFRAAETDAGADVETRRLRATETDAEMRRFRAAETDAEASDETEKVFASDERHLVVRTPADFLSEDASLADGSANQEESRVIESVGWEILASHLDGSVERAAQSGRNRNLATGLGVLGLMTVSVGVLFWAENRSHRFARQQMDFVAGVTHELRTPLTIIRSAADNLIEGVVSDPEKTRRYGQLIQGESRRLSTLVESALSLAEITRGSERKGESIDLRPTLPKMVERSWRLQKSVDSAPAVSWNVPGNLPKVTVDRDALERAIENLLNNALKHGGPGSAVRVEVSNEDLSFVRITVSDNGGGIDPGEEHRVFEPFYRGERSKAEQIPGSGLGLGVVEQSMRAMGGRASLTNHPGEGCSFHLDLPVDPA